jgi:uncharacterized protein (DUF58 family)
MNQTDLIVAVAERAGLTKADAGRAVEALVGTITEALRRGEEVRVAGFGSFDLALRPSKPADLRLLAEYIVSGLPRIGRTKASTLLQRFGSVRGVFTANAAGHGRDPQLRLEDRRGHRPPGVMFRHNQRDSFQEPKS